MKPRHRRLAWILVGLLALSVATALVLNAFRSNLVFFFTPSEVAQGKAVSYTHLTLPTILRV